MSELLPVSTSLQHLEANVLAGQEGQGEAPTVSTIFPKHHLSIPSLLSFSSATPKSLSPCTLQFFSATYLTPYL